MRGLTLARVHDISASTVQWCARPASPPSFSERCEISNSVRVSSLACNWSERLWLRARTFLVALEIRLGCHGDLPWLVGGIKLKTYASSSPPSPLRLPCSRQNANTTLSLQRGRWNLAISYGWDLTIFDKDHDTTGSRRFLQPSIRLRYNYYIQLVATKRDWMRVPNLKFWSARQRGGWSWSPLASALKFYI
jgi:hypothetical protein